MDLDKNKKSGDGFGGFIVESIDEKGNKSQMNI